MAIVNPQSELIREQNLLVPHRKPAGSVRLDVSNSLADGLVGFYVWRGISDSEDLLGNRISVVTNSSNIASNYLIDGEPTLATTGTLAVNDLCITSSDIANRLSSSDDITVLARFYVHELDADQGLFGFGTAQWSWLDTSGGVLRVSAYTNYDTTNTITAAGWNTVGITWRADNTYQCYANRSIGGSGTKSRLSMTGDIALFATTTAAGKGIAGSNTIPTDNCTGSWIAVWNREISPTEYLAMNDDPYQMLVPA